MQIYYESARPSWVGFPVFAKTRLFCLSFPGKTALTRKLNGQFGAFLARAPSRSSRLTRIVDVNVDNTIMLAFPQSEQILILCRPGCYSRNNAKA
jgi:hypothetical protein